MPGGGCGARSSSWECYCWGLDFGFVVLPVVQGTAAGIDPYTAICRALGILPGSPARQTPTSDTAAQPVTRVSWNMETFGALYQADRANGARLAEERCIACHTVEGNTPDPSIPRNLGQSRFALYKQLHDYRSGARINDVMSPLVKDLDEKAIADLAAYYGALVRAQSTPTAPRHSSWERRSRTSSGTAISPGAYRLAPRATAPAPVVQSRRPL